jgi:hypothetical protein
MDASGWRSKPIAVCDDQGQVRSVALGKPNNFYVKLDDDDNQRPVGKQFVVRSDRGFFEVHSLQVDRVPNTYNNHRLS